MPKPLNFAQEYRQGLKIFQDPPPCIRCPDNQIILCAEKIQECQKFDRYIKLAVKPDFPKPIGKKTRYMYNRSPQPQSKETELTAELSNPWNILEQDAADGTLRELELDEVLVFG